MIEEAGSPFRETLILAAFCGLRASEIHGLRWQDVDFDERVIRVRQRADRYGRIGDPKSEAGVRDIPVSSFVLNAMKEYRLQTFGDDLVFPGRGGSPRSHNAMMRVHFRPAAQKQGASFRFHDLRHFAVSQWIAQGFNPKTVSVFAGHSTIAITFDTYGHLIPDVGNFHDGMDAVSDRVMRLGAT